MTVFTDVPELARQMVGLSCAVPLAGGEPLEPDLRCFLEAYAGGYALELAGETQDPFWRHLVIREVAPSSQYDRLIELARSGSRLPDRLACIARSGSGFRGFRERHWVGAAGNLHLAVHLSPQRRIQRFETAFLVLAAVSVAEAIDTIPGLEGKAKLKWVNDVLVHGAKVAGVLAHTQLRGELVSSAILGIGVNVEVTPPVVPTPFVPAAGSLREFAPDPAIATLPRLLGAVLRSLAVNYERLLERGCGELLQRYRARSAVLGEWVSVSAERADERLEILAEGRVIGIGDGLELWLEDRPEPLTRGRLVLLPSADPRTATATAPAAAPPRLTEARVP